MSDIHICMYNNHLWGCSSPHVTSWIFGSWPRSWPLENWTRQDSAGNPGSALPSGRIYIRTGAAVGGSTSVSTSSNAAPWQLAMFWQHPLLGQVMKYCFEVFVGDCLWVVATWFKLLGIRALTSIADGFHWWLTSFFPFLQAAKHVGIQEYPRCSAWTPQLKQELPKHWPQGDIGAAGMLRWEWWSWSSVWPCFASWRLELAWWGSGVCTRMQRSTSWIWISRREGPRPDEEFEEPYYPSVLPELGIVRKNMKTQL